MTITELFKDVLDNAKERLKNPLSGAFLWSLIIFNWRPIVILLFSDRSIEHRIIDINHDYCTGWAAIIMFGVPLLMALFYTIALPWIMLQIEKILQNTNEKRIANTYITRGVKMDGKIILADKEFELQNKRSGNKKLEDLQKEKESLSSQIVALQESIVKINESNTVTIEGLNNSLKSTQEALKVRDSQLNARHWTEVEKDLVDIEDEGLVNYRNIVKESINLLEPRKLGSVLYMIDSLTKKDFEALSLSLFTAGKELVLSEDEDFLSLDRLVAKNIMEKTIKDGRLSYKLTDNGAVVYSAILRDRLEKKKKS